MERVKGNAGPKREGRERKREREMKLHTIFGLAQ